MLSGSESLLDANFISGVLVCSDCETVSHTRSSHCSQREKERCGERDKQAWGMPNGLKNSDHEKAN